MSATPNIVCQDFLGLFGKFKGCLNSLAEEYGLTRVQLQVLYVLHEKHTLPMGQIADVMYCDASNVTGIIDRLVAQGLVDRREDEKDRRTKNLLLTTKGTNTIGQIMKRLPAELGCTKLTAQELSTVHSSLQKLLV